MIYLYDFEATKEMMDHVGPLAELKLVKARADPTGHQEPVTSLQSLQRTTRTTSSRPNAARRIGGWLATLHQLQRLGSLEARRA